MNRPQNEFIWIRTYADKSDLETKGKAIQAEIAKAGIKLGVNVAKMEVREVRRRLPRRRNPEPCGKAARRSLSWPPKIELAINCSSENDADDEASNRR